MTTKRSRRPTKKEHQERVESVMRLMCQAVNKGDIKRVMKSRYGVGFRTTERYMARARQHMLEATQVPKEIHVSDAYHFYRSIVSDRDASTRDRTKAQERIDKLLGLESPARHELSGPDGGPVDLRSSIAHELMERAERDYEPLVFDPQKAVEHYEREKLEHKKSLGIEDEALQDKATAGEAVEQVHESDRDDSGTQ